MRLAVFTDIHGNLDALDAVLADLKAQGGADHIWCLGDLAAFGPDPAACVRRVRDDIPKIKVIQGNTDRYLVTGVRPRMPNPTESSWEMWRDAITKRDEGFNWTADQLDWSETEYLFKLQRDLSLEVVDYGWVIGFHAIPGDDEAALIPDASAHEIRDALLDREGSLAFGGHTHLPMDKDLSDWRMINPGSVGLPFDGDQRAAYVIVTFDQGMVNADFRRVEYDVEAVIKKLTERDYPYKDLIIKRLQTAQA